jgi:hypothetical protein
MKFNKIAQWITLLGSIALLVFYFSNNHKVYERANNSASAVETHAVSEKKLEKESTVDFKSLSINELTTEERVVGYVRQNGRLPDYYITKNKAREKGWDASDGNLCEVLPGKAIGGDRFGNREKQLPAEKGRIYYEADLNYNCGNRGSDRLIFSNDGLIFVTYNHYKTFEKK